MWLRLNYWMSRASCRLSSYCLHSGMELFDLFWNKNVPSTSFGINYFPQLNWAYFPNSTLEALINVLYLGVVQYATWQSSFVTNCRSSLICNHISVLMITEAHSFLHCRPTRRYSLILPVYPDTIANCIKGVK